MKFIYTKLLLLVIFISFFTACKPDLGNEQNRFINNILRINKQIGKYPSLGKFFLQIIIDAEKKWSIAEKESNNDKKIEIMTDVNNKIQNNKFLNAINSYEKNIIKINKMINDFDYNKDVAHRALIKRLKFKSDEAIKKTLIIIKQINPDSIITAVEDINKSNNILLDSLVKIREHSDRHLNK